MRHLASAICVVAVSATLAGCDGQKKDFVAQCVEDGETKKACSCIYEILDPVLEDDEMEALLLGRPSYETGGKLMALGGEISRECEVNIFGL